MKLMKNNSLKEFDLVEIFWVDSVHENGWKQLDVFRDSLKSDGYGIKHSTIGYMISIDDKVISVCQSRNLEEKYKPAVDAIMTIPICSVTSINKLKDGKVVVG